MKIREVIPPKHSLFFRFMIPLVAIIAVQAILFYGTTLWGNSMRIVEDNAYSVLSQQVENRQSYLQSSMLHNWSNIYDVADNINHSMDSLVVEAGSTQQVLASDEYVARLLDGCSEEIIYTLRKASVTGAYIIVDNPYQTSHGTARDGLYLHDPDPSTSSTDNSDLVVICGSSDISRKLGVTTDVDWIPYVMLSHDSNPIMDRPISAAQKNPLLPLNELGYWWYVTDSNVVSYSLPLRDSSGVVYGVLGIELSADYLRGQLPYREIDEGGSGSYAVVTTTDKGSSFTPTVFSHSSQSNNFIGSSGLHLKPSATRDDVSVLQLGAGVDTEVVALVEYLSLYGNTSPYSDEQWALVGMVDSSSLLGFLADIRRSAVLTGLVLMVFLSLFSILIFRTLVRPIEALVAKLHSSSPHRPVELVPSGIREIDELALAIEQMSLRVHESSSMLSRIIKLSNIKIAAFEGDTVTHETTYTDQFFPLLGLEQPLADGYCLPSGGFHDAFDSLEYEVEETHENSWVLRLTGDRRSVRWVRFIIIDYNTRLLGVVTDITSEVMSKRRIEYERDYDLLTNLLNRRAFLQTMDKLFADPVKLKVAAMIMLDLDNLKHINDTYGHDIGDGYIEATANILKRLPIQNMVVARMSGDEFFAFIYGYDNVGLLQMVVDTIKESIGNTFFTLPGTDSIRVRCSAGVAWYPQDSQSVDMLIKQADFAMYTAKNSKKGDFCKFDSASYNQNSYLLHSREELNKLIDGNLVSYHFQPIISARTGAVFAYEALMRSQLETLRNPLEVLSLAKSQSKLYEIERLTWFNALKLAAGDVCFVDGSCKLFVNSVSNQILTEQDIKQLYRLYTPYLSRLVLEVTEEEKFTEDVTQRKQDVMNAWGGQVALDDFGTGYNSDVALLMIAPHYVKIDMSIVRNIDTDSGRQGIFRNLVSYSQEHGIKVIAEGVETASEMETLIRLGADYLQGYYVGMPSAQMADTSRAIIDEIQHISGADKENSNEEIKIWTKS